MKVYNYLRDELGHDSYVKGMQIPYFYVDYYDRYEESKNYVHLFHVKSSSSPHLYEIEIRSNGNEIYSSNCTCKQYENYQTCKHIAACIINYHYEIASYEKVDEYKESKEILNIFYEPQKEFNIKERVNLKIDLEFYENNIFYRLYLGTNKLYVLNNRSKFDKFVNAYYNGGDYSLGAKFIYNRSNHYFDEEDTNLLNYLFSFSRNSYEPFSLEERDLNYIIENISLPKITIHKDSINAIIKDMPTSFNLIKNNAGDYELTLENISKYEFLGSSFKYAFYQNVLYVLPEDNSRLLIELAKHRLTSLTFKKQDIAKFSKGLLRNIKNKLVVSPSISEIKINKEPTSKIYLDIKNDLSCKINILYEDSEINILTKDNDIIRDYDYEEKILTDFVNAGFTICSKNLIITDIDKIGYFLDTELPKLSTKYEIYTSKNLNNTNIIKKSRIMKDFSIGTTGIMSFSFSIDNLNEEEISDILSSLEHKKTYHRLKNGNIINLTEDNELQEFSHLLKDLEIESKSLSTNMEIPKYKALYIDSLKHEKYQDINTNSIFNDFITNFKNYQKATIKLSKTDSNILRDYQKVGVNWLYSIYKCDLGCILADEMGLGKSIQTICFLKAVLKEKKDAKILIVCPTSLVYNWEKEFTKFGSELKYITISDNKEKRTSIIKDSNYNIFITSYGLLRNDIKEYQDKCFEICIIDEAQYIKNYQAKMTLSLKSLNAKIRIALTGTPIENSVIELWSIFDFLMPGYLNSVKKFHEKYHISDIKKEDLERLESLNKQIAPFILRRKKNEVYKDLPDKIENNIYLDLPEAQKKLYVSVLKDTEKEIENLVGTVGFKSAQFKILTLLTRLREICIAPSVIYENYEDEEIKITKLIEMLKDYAKDNHKVLVFSSFKRVLDLVKTHLTKNHISFYSIDGSVKGKERLPLVDKFNEDDTTCFLITLKSGGTGLNLTSADIVIHLDIWWNPQAENQATDRAHRIGQTKKVLVNRLIARGTIEERIIELQNKKRLLSDNLIEGKASTDVLSNITEEELKELLNFSGN